MDATRQKEQPTQPGEGREATRLGAERARLLMAMPSLTRRSNAAQVSE